MWQVSECVKLIYFPFLFCYQLGQLKTQFSFTVVILGEKKVARECKAGIEMTRCRAGCVAIWPGNPYKCAFGTATSRFSKLMNTEWFHITKTHCGIVEEVKSCNKFAASHFILFNKWKAPKIQMSVCEYVRTDTLVCLYKKLGLGQVPPPLPT